MSDNKVVFESHEDMVAKLKADPSDIIGNLSVRGIDLIHMMMDMSGEVGELTDAIKKHVAYDKELDMDHIIEEMGDIEFYFEGLRQALGIDRNDVLAQNVAKLSKRYSSGSFSQDQAIDRADKSEV